jgi:hypothetical protein
LKKYFKMLKEGVLNFVGAHPGLTTVLAGLGITVAFSSMGRLAVHEALTSATTGIYHLSTPADLPPVSGVQYAYACSVNCIGPGLIQADPTHHLIANVMGHNVQASSHGVSAGIIGGKPVVSTGK